MTPTVKECHALTSHYVKAYKGRYGYEPVVNRYAARYGFDSVLLGIPLDAAKDLLDYYFKTENTKGHALNWFFSHYDELIEAQSAAVADAAWREKLRRESEIRVQEWRARGNHGIENN